MIKQLICWIKHRHEYEQFDRKRYEDGYPIIRYGKECRLCGRKVWMS